MTASSLQSLGQRGTSRSTVGIAALIIVLILLGTLLGVLGYRGLSDLEKPQDDPAWSIFQLGFEHERLLLATETSVDVDAVRLRGDIYLSRVALLRDAPALANVRDNLDPNKLTDFLESTDLTDRLLRDVDTPSGREALVSQLRRNAASVRGLMIDMTNLNRVIQNDDRGRQVRQLVFSIVALEILLAVLIALCIFVLRISSKLARANVAALASADLLKKNMELELERARADEASKAKTQFLSNMSHEIRTPLNGIIGTLQLVDQAGLSRENSDYVEIVQRSSQSLLEIVNGILDISKIEANEEIVSKRKFDTRNLISDVLSHHEVRANERGVDILVRVDDAVPKFVYSDPLKIEQILNNLISNALKFTERGWVKLTLMRLCAVSDDHSRCDGLQIEVADTGIGISESDRARLFQPFWQVDGSLTRRFRGTGLGLSIVRKLSMMMGGEVSLESTPGLGSTFTVLLPDCLREEDQDYAPPSVTGPAQGLKVVLLGADFATVFRAGQIVAQLGASLHEIRTPEDAVDFARSSTPTACAAVVDRRFAGDALRFLDGMAGEEGCAWQVPTIMIQGSSDEKGPRSNFIVGEIFGRFSRSSFMESLQRSNLFTLDGAPRAPGDGSHQSADLARVKNLNILVVDDNSINRRVLERLLRKIGAEQVETASGALDALERTSRKNFDLVFMDIQMPDIDGYSATRLIRQHGLSTIKIVACSAHAFQGDVTRSSEEGLDEHLSKPVVLADLQSLLRRLFPAVDAGLQAGTEPM